MGKGKRLAALLGTLTTLAVPVAGSPAHAAIDPTGFVTPVTSLPEADQGPVATTLSDGRVLSVGVYGSWLYGASSGNWSAAADAGTNNVTAIAPLPDDRALLLAEQYSSSTTAAQIYDGASDTWTSAPTVPGGTTGVSAAALPDGGVLAAGGWSNAQQQTVATTEIFDPTKDSWSAGAPMIEPMWDLHMVLVSGKVLAFGIRAVDGPTVSLLQTYDPSTDSWTEEVLPGTFADVSGAAALPNGNVALSGTGTAQTISTQVTDMLYDPADDGLVYGEALPQDGGSAALATVGGTVLVIGGTTDSSTTSGNTQTITSTPTARVLSWSPEPTSPATELDPTLQAYQSGSYWYGGEPITASSNDYGHQPRSFQLQHCTASGCFADGDPVKLSSDTGTASFTIPEADIGSMLRVVLTVGHQVVTSLNSPVVQDLNSGSGNPAPGITPTPTYSVTAPSGQPVQLGTAAAQFGIQRNVSDDDATVNYTISFPTANLNQAFPPITGTAHFPANFLSVNVPIPATDDGVAIPTGTVQITIDSPSDGVTSGGAPVDVSVLAAPATATTRNSGDPLGTNAASPGNPLSGASFYVDRSSIAARVAYLWRNTHPTDSGLLRGIAGQPDVRRFGAWNGTHPGHAVGMFLNQAARKEPGTIPMISTYRIIHGQCDEPDQTVADEKAYDAWVASFATGIGNHSAVLFLEMDSLITTPCLDKAGLAIRLAELRDAVSVLSRDPHLVVYLDAGAADALNPRRAAALLKAADVAQTQGFFLNATHFDWTKKEIAYGETISKLIGGKHFVINTAENGQGPLIPKDRAVNGNEVLCNPPGRGLGPLPTANTGYPNVDAFAWIANPGVSGGQCRRGAPKTGVFWPAEAVSLAKHADFAVR